MNILEEKCEYCSLSLAQSLIDKDFICDDGIPHHFIQPKLIEATDVEVSENKGITEHCN